QLCVFFFNDTATTEIYTLSLHDALPISSLRQFHLAKQRQVSRIATQCAKGDRKSTRLNSSHSSISYAVFCLKKNTECACRLYETEDAHRDTFNVPARSSW